MQLMLAEQWYILEGAWTPLIALCFLAIWARVVSSIFDKDALYWHFKRQEWNIGHMVSGALGFIVMVLPVPVPWWPAIGFTVGLLVMFASTIAYWIYHNRNVPEDKKFRLSAATFQQRLASRAAAKALRTANVSIIDYKGDTMGVPTKDDPQFIVHVAMEQLLAPALLRHASAVEISPSKNGHYQVSQVVDTMRYRADPIEPSLANAVIDYLKKRAGCDVEDKRRQQMGDFIAKMGVDSHDIRLRAAGSSAGQSMILDVDIKKRTNIKPTDLGLLPAQLESLSKATDDMHGIVLVVAPKSGGRSTALYSLLRRHDAFTSNIRTLEYEQLQTLDGVGHNVFKPSEGIVFSIVLRSMLRRDPTIMMIEDLTDDKTAREAAGPGMNGPLMYIGVRADTGYSGLATWCKAVGDLNTASAAMKAVVSMRLLRRLCETCKTAYQPDPNELRKLGLPPDRVKQLFKPTGVIIDRNREETCPACGGLKYRGVIGAYEVMTFDSDARALLAKGDLDGLKTHMKRHRTISIQESALRRAIEGVTSIEEVMRISKSGAATNAAPQPAEAGV